MLLLFDVLKHLLIGALILVAGFFPVIFLAGPHSGILPRGLEPVVWIAYAAMIIGVPWVIRGLWKKRRRPRRE